MVRLSINVVGKITLKHLKIKGFLLGQGLSNLLSFNISLKLPDVTSILRTTQQDIHHVSTQCIYIHVIFFYFEVERNTKMLYNYHEW